MMPYDENVNRFEAARKSFQWMERSKPSVAARGDGQPSSVRDGRSARGHCRAAARARLRPRASDVRDRQRGSHSMVQRARNITSAGKPQIYPQSVACFLSAAAFSVELFTSGRFCATLYTMNLYAVPGAHSTLPQHRLSAGGDSMSVFWQSLLAVFAAVGFYTVLHVVYERICAHMLRQHGSAELTLYGDGCDPASEQLIRAAWQRSGAEYRQISRGAAGYHVSGIKKAGEDGALWTKKNM